MQPLLIAAFAASIAVAVVLWARYNVLRREAFIRNVELPRGLFDKLRARHPHMTVKDCQLVAHGLRQFFLAYLKSGRKLVSMPSQVVDDLWHEFILYTRNYENFCRKAFGRFLHHTPAEVLSSNRRKNEGLRRCWWFVCREENINPRAATRLPLLFALDAKLGIPGGYSYVTDCTGVRRDGARAGASAPYCAGDFASASFDGGTDGFADGGHDGGSSDGAGGDGCGGGGCGGGGD